MEKIVYINANLLSIDSEEVILCAKSTEFQDIRIRNDSWMIMRISTIQITTRIGIIWIIMQINAIRTMMRIGVAEIATMMTTMTIDGTV